MYRFKDQIIESVRDQIINTTLLVASAIGLLTYSLSLSRIFNIGFHPSFIFDFLVIASLGATTILRNKLSGRLKIIITISLILLFALSDAFNYGLFSSARIYLILIPFFSIFFSSFKHTMITFIITVIAFLFIGYLHHTEYLKIPPGYEPEIYILKFYPWVINVLHISIIALVIFFITHKLLKTYAELVEDLQSSRHQISISERNYREIFNTSSDAIFIHNTDGTIVDVNDAMLKMYGYENRSEIESLSIEAFSSSNPPYTSDYATNFFLQALNVGSVTFDWQAKKKSGEVFWVEVALKKANIADRERLVAMVRDITEKKRIAIELENYKDHLEVLVQKRTEELESLNEELRATNDELFNQREELENTVDELQTTQDYLIESEKMASLGVLSAGIAHEINNPLNFINGGITGVEGYMKENTPEHLSKVQPLFQSIKEGIRRAANIITSLNHYSRKDDSKNEHCDMNLIIKNCAHMLHNQMKERIEVVFDFQKQEHFITGNEGRLHQVLLNILSNAAQAIEGKGKISINTFEKDSKLLISITDSGCGIKPEILPRITDPFFTTKDPGKGTGLGLSIASKIILDHNGTLKFESSPGKGTKVLISLPINKSDE